MSLGQKYSRKKKGSVKDKTTTNNLDLLNAVETFINMSNHASTATGVTSNQCVLDAIPITYPILFSMCFRKFVYDFTHDFCILLVWLIVQEVFILTTSKQQSNPCLEGNSSY